MPPELLGLSLGFAAGISPGPLLGLVMRTSLERGFWAGTRVALSPLLTDAPIIALCLLVVSALPVSFAALLGLFGGAFVIYLGIEGIRAAQHASLLEQPAAVKQSQDFLRGALVNILSPHPWLFWLGIGAPTLHNAYKLGVLHAAGFLLGFFVLLIGMKISLAFLISSGKRFLTQKTYKAALYLSSVLMFLAGFILVLETVRSLLKI
jgi:threonine/homoserine/homoserine lactone efflux protein